MSTTLIYYTFTGELAHANTPSVPADVVHGEAWLTPGVQHGHQLLLQAPVAADEGLGQRQFVLHDERHTHLQGETEELQISSFHSITSETECEFTKVFSGRLLCSFISYFAGN